MKRVIETPCRTCNERKATCHATCSEYSSWKKAVEEEKSHTLTNHILKGKYWVVKGKG